MNPSSLPEGYSARPTRMDDAAAVAAVVTACMQETSAEELVDDWQQMDLAEQAVVIIAPGGRIVASGDISNRGNVRLSMYGYVHPDQRGRGLGGFLVEWAERWVQDRMSEAPDGVQVVLEFYANQADEAAAHLLETRGYPLVRTVFVMEASLNRALPAPAWPEGIRPRTFRPGVDEQASFEAVEDAFRDSWSHAPGTLERWLSFMRSDSFDPSLILLPEDARSAEIAGYCRAQVTGGKAWIPGLAVRPPWRRRGLGLAMLQYMFGELHRREVPMVGLSVDSESPTGAPRLYTRAGMKVTESYGIYRREIRPGADFTTALA